MMSSYVKSLEIFVDNQMGKKIEAATTFAVAASKYIIFYCF